MNIGVDLDGVLFDSENYFRTYSRLYNFENIKKPEVDKEELYFSNRFKWTQEEVDEFFDQYMEMIELKAPIMPMAKEILQRFKDMGHKLYIITNRGSKYKVEIEVTKKRLEELGIDFDGVNLGVHNKAEKCKELGIELMIDDLYNNVDNVSKSGIKCLYFRDLVLKQFDQSNKYVHEVRNWADVYIEVLDYNNWVV